MAEGTMDRQFAASNWHEKAMKLARELPNTPPFLERVKLRFKEILDEFEPVKDSPYRDEKIMDLKRRAFDISTPTEEVSALALFLEADISWDAIDSGRSHVDVLRKLLRADIPSHIRESARTALRLGRFVVY